MKKNYNRRLNKLKLNYISIVLCTYNRSELLVKALNCMIKQETDCLFLYDIVVVDDGSTDGTDRVVKEMASKSSISIKYIQTKGKGISHARNTGIFSTNSEWIAFFDQDQITEPNWLKQLYSSAQKTGLQIIDGPRDLVLNDSKLYMLCKTRRRILGERLGPIKKWNTREGPNTGNVLIHRRCFEKIGTFDESILWGGEDLDFFMRAKEAGYKVGYAQLAVVHHLIPDERLTSGYFKWNSMRCGSNFARMDCKFKGIKVTIASCLLRMIRACVIDVPQCIFYMLLNQHSKLMGIKCILWRTSGYFKMTLLLLFPDLFSQTYYFKNIRFRNERKFYSESKVNL